MGKGKLAKFAENETFSCLIQPSADEVLRKDDPLKGRWNQDVFVGRLGGAEAPIVVELGCGKGEYTIDLSRRESTKNYIGVDIKGARLWRGAKTATESGLKNVAFLRTRIEFINSLFAPGEVSEIWITFCDPQPKKPSKRLTSPEFLERYSKFLKPGGIIHLKTDSQELHQYTLDTIRRLGLELLACTSDLYGSGAPLDSRSEEYRYGRFATVPGSMEGVRYIGLEHEPDGCCLDGPLLSQPALREVRTHYENLFLAEGMPITYLAFKL